MSHPANEMTPDIRFRNVRFSYESMSNPLFEGLTFHVTRGWTGVVGANGAGKTTLLMLATGLLQPDSGEVQSPGKSLHCPQRTDSVPPGLNDLAQLGHSVRIGYVAALAPADGS